MKSVWQQPILFLYGRHGCGWLRDTAPLCDALRHLVLGHSSGSESLVMAPCPAKHVDPSWRLVQVPRGVGVGLAHTWVSGPRHHRSVSDHARHPLFSLLQTGSLGSRFHSCTCYSRFRMTPRSGEARAIWSGAFCCPSFLKASTNVAHTDNPAPSGHAEFLLGICLLIWQEKVLCRRRPTPNSAPCAPPPTGRNGLKVEFRMQDTVSWFFLDGRFLIASLLLFFLV